MILKIGGFIALVIAAIVIYAAVQPSKYEIKRDVSINAPAEKIFPWLNNAAKINQWMPWTDIDPQVVMTAGGASEGVGSVSNWKSPGQMGEGMAVIDESVPNVRVKTNVVYYKPMAMTQVAYFTVNESNGASTVQWSVEGHNNLIGRIMCIFVSLDKMVGPNFEMGLKKLKNFVENS